jgi:hypothetical protein
MAGQSSHRYFGAGERWDYQDSTPCLLFRLYRIPLDEKPSYLEDSVLKERERKKEPCCLTTHLSINLGMVAIRFSMTIAREVCSRKSEGTTAIERWRSFPSQRDFLGSVRVVKACGIDVARGLDRPSPIPSHLETMRPPNT